MPPSFPKTISPLARTLWIGVATLPLYAIAVYSFFHKPLAMALLQRSSYFLLTALLVLWVCSLIRCLREEAVPWGALARRYGSGTLLALVLTASAGVAVKPGFRILSDESNLASVAQSMTFQKTVENVTEGFYYYGNFRPLQRKTPGLEKRPYLYPYLVQMLHALLGYDIRNIYRVNLFLMFSLLFLIQMLLEPYVEKIWVHAALIAAAAQPLLSMCATSGGYDLCAAVCLLLSLVMIKKFLEAPEAAHRLEFLWLTLVATFQSRPDSGAYSASACVLLAAFGCLRREHLKSAWLLVVTPLFVLPNAWQKLLVKNYYESKLDEIPFAVSHFLHNTRLFLGGMTEFVGYTPYATVVNLIGSAGLVFGATFLMMRADVRQKFLAVKGARDFAFIAAIVLAEKWVVTASYFRGDPLHSADARYYVLIACLLSMSAVLFLRKLFGAKQGTLMLLFTIFLYVYYMPISVAGRYVNTQILPRQYNYTLDVLKKYATPNTLIIADRPNQYSVLNYGTISFYYANVNKDIVLRNYSRHLYDQILVVQNVSYRDEKALPGSHLMPDYQLQTVSSLQNEAANYTRVSRVVRPSLMHQTAFPPNLPAPPADDANEWMNLLLT